MKRSWRSSLPLLVPLFGLVVVMLVPKAPPVSGASVTRRLGEPWWTEVSSAGLGLAFAALLLVFLAGPKIWHRLRASAASARAVVCGAAVLQWTGVVLLTGLLMAAYLGQPAIVMRPLAIFGCVLYVIGYTHLLAMQKQAAEERRRLEARAIRLG